MSEAESGTPEPVEPSKPAAAEPADKEKPDKEKPEQPDHLASEQEAKRIYGAEALAENDADDAERIRRLGRLDPTFSFEEQVRNTGAAAWGEQARVYQTNYYQGVPGDQPGVPSAHPLSPDAVVGVFDTHAEVDNHGELVGRLREHRLQILSGSPSTGRRSTATVALMDALHSDNGQRCDGTCACGGSLANLLLEPKTQLSALLSWRAENGESGLDERHGYLLELTAADRAHVNDLTSAVLGPLRKILQERDAFLVFLVDEELLLGNRSTTEEVLVHVRPSVEAMLTVRLTKALGSFRASELTADPLLKECLVTLSLPSEVAALVKELIARETTGEPLEDVLARSSGRLKESIRNKLRDGTAGRNLLEDQSDGSDRPADRIALRKQAFLIAAAVLDGHRLTEVLDAADQLIARLVPPRAGHAPAVRELFGYRIEDLLSFLQDTGESVSHPRTIRLAADQMVAAIIDVCWNEYAGLREPLLHWLCDLAEGDPTRKAKVWRSAAQMIGKLATYDFRLVLKTVIEPWAASPRQADRRAAATALEVVALNEPQRAHVSRLLARWINGKSFQEQDTAVLAYQTKLGQMFPTDAWAGLTRLVEDDRYAWSHSISFGLDNLAARTDDLAGFRRAAGRLVGVEAATGTRAGGSLFRLADKTKRGSPE